MQLEVESDPLKMSKEQLQMKILNIWYSETKIFGPTQFLEMSKKLGVKPGQIQKWYFEKKDLEKTQKDDDSFIHAIHESVGIGDMDNLSEHATDLENGRIAQTADQHELDKSFENYQKLISPQRISDSEQNFQKKDEKVDESSSVKKTNSELTKGFASEIGASLLRSKVICEWISTSVNNFRRMMCRIYVKQSIYKFMFQHKFMFKAVRL